jgi:hypothetical protein
LNPPSKADTSSRAREAIGRHVPHRPEAGVHFDHLDFPDGAFVVAGGRSLTSPVALRERSAKNELSTGDRIDVGVERKPAYGSVVVRICSCSSAVRTP